VPSFCLMDVSIEFNCWGEKDADWWI